MKLANCRLKAFEYRNAVLAYNKWVYCRIIRNNMHHSFTFESTLKIKRLGFSDKDIIHKLALRIQSKARLMCHYKYA